MDDRSPSDPQFYSEWNSQQQQDQQQQPPNLSVSTMFAPNQQQQYHLSPVSSASYPTSAASSSSESHLSPNIFDPTNLSAVSTSQDHQHQHPHLHNNLSSPVSGFSQPFDPTPTSMSFKQNDLPKDNNNINSTPPPPLAHPQPPAPPMIDTSNTSWDHIQQHNELSGATGSYTPSYGSLHSAYSSREGSIFGSPLTGTSAQPSPFLLPDNTASHDIPLFTSLDFRDPTNDPNLDDGYSSVGLADDRSIHSDALSIHSSHSPSNHHRTPSQQSNASDYAASLSSRIKDMSMLEQHQQQQPYPESNNEANDTSSPIYPHDSVSPSSSSTRPQRIPTPQRDDTIRPPANSSTKATATIAPEGVAGLGTNDNNNNNNNDITSNTTTGISTNIPAIVSSSPQENDSNTFTGQFLSTSPPGSQGISRVGSPEPLDSANRNSNNNNDNNNIVNNEVINQQQNEHQHQQQPQSQQTIMPSTKFQSQQQRQQLQTSVNEARQPTAGTLEMERIFASLVDQERNPYRQQSLEMTDAYPNTSTTSTTNNRAKPQRQRSRSDAGVLNWGRSNFGGDSNLLTTSSISQSGITSTVTSSASFLGVDSASSSVDPRVIGGADPNAPPPPNLVPSARSHSALGVRSSEMPTTAPTSSAPISPMSNTTSNYDNTFLRPDVPRPVPSSPRNNTSSFMSRHHRQAQSEDFSSFSFQANKAHSQAQQQASPIIAFQQPHIQAQQQAQQQPQQQQQQQFNNVGMFGINAPPPSSYGFSFQSPSLQQPQPQQAIPDQRFFQPIPGAPNNPDWRFLQNQQGQQGQQQPSPLQIGKQQPLDQHQRASPSTTSPSGLAVDADLKPIYWESQTTKATKHAADSRRKAGTEAKFVCKFCSSTFTRAYNLKGHLRAHMNEKPFVCQVAGCHKSFARAHDLKRHSALHNDVSRYKCLACSRAFKRRDALQRHHKSENGQICVSRLIAQGHMSPTSQTQHPSSSSSSKIESDSPTDNNLPKEYKSSAVIL